MKVKFFDIREAWPLYVTWFAARGLRAPTPTLSGIFVGDAAPIAGCLLYPTTGEYLFAEHAATNHLVSPRLRHAYFLEMLIELRRSATWTGKRAMAVVEPRKGISKLLLKQGWRISPTLQWYAG